MTARSWAAALVLAAAAGCGQNPTSTTCADDDGCPLGEYCEDGSCTRDCAIDLDCESVGAGARCTMRGRCLVGPDAGGSDAGPDGCVSSADCDDGVWCNGMERCAPGTAGADPRGCAPPGSLACPADSTCVERERSCRPCASGADADRDGVDASACGGTDCDDDDADRFPGNPERCDADAPEHDEDCRPTTFGRRDVDADGYVDDRCANAFDGVEARGDDCDDMEVRAFEGSPENPCDGIDNDCDSTIDEGMIPTFYLDEDEDGWGAAERGTMEGCNPPEHYVDRDGDCAPEDESINPGRSEICNGGLDDNCDRVVDSEALEGMACTTSLPGRCGRGVTECVSGSPAPACVAADGAATPACSLGEERACMVCGTLPGRERCDGCDYGVCSLTSVTGFVGLWQADDTPGVTHACGEDWATGTWRCGSGPASCDAVLSPTLSLPGGEYTVTLNGNGLDSGASDLLVAYVAGTPVVVATTGGTGLRTGSFRVTGSCVSVRVAVRCWFTEMRSIEMRRSAG